MFVVRCALLFTRDCCLLIAVCCLMAAVCWPLLVMYCLMIAVGGSSVAICG